MTYAPQGNTSLGQLTASKVDELGKAISSQNELILEAYLSLSAVQDDGKKTKTFRQIRDFGVVYAHTEGITLSNEMRRILNKIAKKTYQLQVMPDIEQWKQQIEELSKLAQNAYDELDFMTEEGYLEQVTGHAQFLAVALREEMASIEYTININLNNTYNIKAKRIMLKKLEQKIKTQAEKIQSLNREELRSCYDENYKVASILSYSIGDVVDNCIVELDQYLTKTMTLIDNLQKEQKQQNQRLWALNKFIKNGHYQPNDIQLSYEELMEHGLAYGGMVSGEDFAENLTNVELEDNDSFLLTIVDELSEKKTTIQVENTKSNYDKPVTQEAEEQQNRKVTREQQLVFSYMKFNNKDNLLTTLSVREYWQAFELEKQIAYKSFLALVLHQCKSNFRENNPVHRKQNICWKIYLKTNKQGLADTINIQDAHYLRYDTEQGEPSEQQIWKTA